VILIEVIFSIALFSIIVVYSLNILLSLHEKKSLSTSSINNNLLLETTRLFLIKNNDFSRIKYSEDKLYFDNNLLLNNISKYDLYISNNIATIDICIDKNRVCQIWNIKIL